MSGIAGIFCADGATPEFSLLERIVQQLAFRGPDAKQCAARPGAGFCFSLLRTGPAPQSEAQPVTMDSRFWLLGDVRLDARDELQRRIEEENADVPDRCTDEELILHAWRIWGPACLERLSGDFALAIWDATAQRGWCARDLMGGKPFFYAHKNSTLYFSNTLNALLSCPTISRDLDLHFLGDFLLQGWCPDAERTVYREIRRLPAGHMIEFSSQGLRVRRYTELPVEELLWLKRPEEYVEQYRSVLDEAVRDRLPQGPAAFFMSGGLDSTTVAAISASQRKEASERQSLRAYTVDYAPLFADQEGEYARSVAEHIGIPIAVTAGANCLPFTGYERPVIQMPEPCHEPYLALHFEQYRQVAARARVALSGDGGDNVLTGQAWPFLIHLLRKMQFVRLGGAFGSYFLRHRRIPPLRGGFRRRLRLWTGRENEMADYPNWLDPGFERKINLQERWKELCKPPTAVHPVHPIGYATLSGTYWSIVLEGEDAAWSGVAVETRAPLLDQRVLRFLLRVPPVPWCAKKELLRRATRGLLPEQVRLRPKTPLQGDPLALHVQAGQWKPLIPEKLEEPLRSLVNRTVLDATLAQGTGLSLWSVLCPLSLHYWLKGVEMARGIQ